MWLVGGVSACVALGGALGLAIGRLQLDLAVYLLGGRNLFDGRLYQVSLPGSPHLPFTYPPFAALVFGPLTALPEAAAQVLWALMQVLAVFALLLLSLHAARSDLDRRALVMWSMMLMAPAYWIEPVRLTLSFGQVNIVLAVMVLGDLTWHLRLGGRILPRGVLLGVAAAIKLIPLIFVPYLFVTRQTRAAFVSLGTFALCTAAATAVDPRESWSYWTRYATDAGRVGGVFYISNQSLRAVWDRFDHRIASVGLVTAASVVVAVTGIALAAWAYRTSSSYLGILLCATTGLVVSPITWAHHLVWVVPVLIWLTWARDRPSGGWIWALLGAALFWWAPIWSVPAGGNHELHEHGWQLLAGNSFFFAMVGFMVGVSVMLFRRRNGRSTGNGGSTGRPKGAPRPAPLVRNSV